MMPYNCAKLIFSNSGNRANVSPSQAFLWRGNQRLFSSTHTHKRSHSIKSVARDFAKVNSNKTKVAGAGFDLLSYANGETSTNGASMSKEVLLSNHQYSAMDVSLVGNSKEEAEKERRQRLLDGLGKGTLVESIYRQTFVIRSYEVGSDKTASMATITNFFQEMALNHAAMYDFVGDGNGMGRTHAMVKDRLIWIVTRMHIEVDRYPVWGDVVEIDTWISACRKNGMRRDLLLRDCCTGKIIARGTSYLAMMNEDTRRLSKMPEAVRAEITPCFLDRSIRDDASFTKIPMLDDSATYITAGLMPKFYDMDMNGHVNHVKYIDWVLESVPERVLGRYELKSMTLEYRRECGRADIVDSLTQPEESLSPIALGSLLQPPVQFAHMLRLQTNNTEVLRGRTLWAPKP